MEIVSFYILDSRLKKDTQNLILIGGGGRCSTPSRDMYAGDKVSDISGWKPVKD